MLVHHANWCHGIDTKKRCFIFYKNLSWITGNLNLNAEADEENEKITREVIINYRW